MKKYITFIIVIFIIFLSCKQRNNCNNITSKVNIDNHFKDTNNISVISKTNKLVKSNLDTIYRFDSNAFVSGCANVLLQKISKDLQNELLIELVFDRIPKLKEIDISKYSKSIHIYLKKYSIGNKYVDHICNDAPRFPKDWKEPNKYTAVTGSLTITYWSDKEDIVSAIVKNIVFKDKSNCKLIIPFESFMKIRVHWFGG